MKCTRCGCGSYVKAGKKDGRQRYKCKGCGYHYSVAKRGYDDEVRYFALKMVSDGMGFRQVARVLEISPMTVMRWVRSYGEQLLQKARKHLDQQTCASEVELDELCTFIRKKNSNGGYGFVLIAIPGASSPSDSVTVVAPH